MDDIDQEHLNDDVRDVRRWLAEHEKQDNERFNKVMAVLEPIAETYRTAGSIGKLLKAVLLIVSLTVGIFVGWQSLFK